MAYCAECGRLLEDGCDFCPECGTPVNNAADVFSNDTRVETKTCPLCHEEMPIDTFYCFNCGYTFNNNRTDFDEMQKRIQLQSGLWRNKWIALALCIFFGFLGAHKFYEGKAFLGVIYIFTLGLFGIGWFVDIIRIATKPNPYLV